MELGETLLFLDLFMFGKLLTQCPLGVTAGLCPVRAMAIFPRDVEGSVSTRDVYGAVYWSTISAQSQAHSLIIIS
jgi:hypothetical protein